jgi:hypothetical protein
MALFFTKNELSTEALRSTEAGGECRGSNVEGEDLIDTDERSSGGGGVCTGE